MHLPVENRAVPSIVSIVTETSPKVPNVRDSSKSTRTTSSSTDVVALTRLSSNTPYGSWLDSMVTVAVVLVDARRPNSIGGSSVMVKVSSSSGMESCMASS